MHPTEGELGAVGALESRFPAGEGGGIVGDAQLQVGLEVVEDEFGGFGGGGDRDRCRKPKLGGGAVVPVAVALPVDGVKLTGGAVE
jgi:hypothetical protein